MTQSVKVKNKKSEWERYETPPADLKDPVRRKARMDSPVAEAQPPAAEREGTISLAEREQLLRLLNFLEKDKINLGDVKVLYSWCAFCGFVDFFLIYIFYYGYNIAS